MNIQKSSENVMKRVLVVISIICAAFIIIWIVAFCRGLWLMFEVEGINSNNLSDYTEEKYTSFNGGDKAYQFLPEYESLSGYQALEFNYFDGTNKSSFLHEYYIVYTLDVYYSADNYIEKKQNALNVDVIDVEPYGDFLICILPQENDVVNCICYCDAKEIIRYLTIVGVPTGDVFVSNILNWNSTSSVKW